jgi:hypothetical protein
MLQRNDSKFRANSGLLEDEALNLGIDAYIYGYPLVLMDLTRAISTNASRPSARAAPVNQFCHVKTVPDHTMTTVIRPNTDTLDSFAWLDIAKEPIVLSVPSTRDRYRLLQMLDAWTNVFASPSTRTTGDREEHFAVFGPHWAGTLPAEVQGIKSPTNMVWIIGHTQTSGKNDYPAVHAIQAQYQLTPLSTFGKPYRPPKDMPVRSDLDMERPPVEQVSDIGASAFFDRLNAIMKQNPPAAADTEALTRFLAVNIGPGEQFGLESLDPRIARGLEACVDVAQTKIISASKKPHSRRQNGWEFMLDVGRYGTDYLWRAAVAHVGLGANLPEDAMYSIACSSADGQLLHGDNSYEITFLKGQLPPVSAFWSITLYNSKHLFARNAIKRYAIGSRDRLKYGDDGSLKIYVQYGSPGMDRESNWLPAPLDTFSLMMRLYWPKKEALEGIWRPPAIERIAMASLRRAA